MRYFTYLKNAIIFNKYKIYNVVKTKAGVTKHRRQPELIVSLTSYPKRFGSAFLAIESLLNQTLQPDKIILWLAEKEVEQNPLPSNLTKLKSRGLEIRIVKENIASYKKLIFTIDQFPQCLIVTCDDDTIYPKWFLKNLYRSYQQYPDFISAYRCRLMGKINPRQLAPYNDWPFAMDKRACYELFPTGSGGVLYPPGALNKKISHRIFMQLCPSADDVWFKAMSLLNRTKTVMVKDESTEFLEVTIKESQKNALWKANTRENKNDEQIKKVFDYFDLYHCISMRDDMCDLTSNEVCE